MKKRSVLYFIVILGLTISAVCAGCTPESPPMDPSLRSDASSQISEKTSHISEGTKQISAESYVSDNKEVSDTVSVPSESLLPQTEPSEETDQIIVWNEHTDLPIKMNYSQELVSGIVNYKCEDVTVLNALVNAIKDIKVTGKSEERYDDDSDELTFNFEDGSEQVVFFEHGGLLKDNVRYRIEGYEPLRNILDSIKESSLSDGTAETYDEWVVNVSKVEQKVSVLCGSEQYKNADIDKKRQLALELLESLEKDGMIENGSVFSTENDVYYQYKGGGSSGIMLKEFDPMMN